MFIRNLAEIKYAFSVYKRIKNKKNHDLFLLVRHPNIPTVGVLFNVFSQKMSMAFWGIFTRFLCIQCRINHGSGGSPEPGPLNSGGLIISQK